jgi:hypothetical protein
MIRSAGKRKTGPPTRNPKRDRGLVTGTVPSSRHNTGFRQTGRKVVWWHDSQRCRAVPQRCEIVVWTGCIRHGPSEPAKTIERRPCARGFSRRRKPGQALQRV